MQPCPDCGKPVVMVRGKYRCRAYEWTGEQKVYVHRGLEPHDTAIITSKEHIITGKRVDFLPRFYKNGRLIPEVWRGWPAKIHDCEEGRKRREKLTAACTGQH